MTAAVAGEAEAATAGSAPRAAAARGAGATANPSRRPAAGQPGWQGRVQQARSRQQSTQRSAGQATALIKDSSPVRVVRASAAPWGAVANNGATQAGGGFLLGVFAWAVGLAYVRGGSAEVRRFLAAKFFNKT